MEFRHIKLFCLILENRSISIAAKKASLSQPTVSQHLRALEEELGVLLFDRVGRRMVPTKAAETLYPYASRALSLMEEGRQALDAHMGLVRGDLKVAGSTIPAHYILPDIFSEFQKVHPLVKLCLSVGDSEWVLDALRARDVELGFVGARLERPGLLFHPFARDELVLVAHAGHPLASEGPLPLGKIASLPILSRERGSGTRASWEALMRQAGLDREDLQIVAELGSTEAVVRGVKAAMGVGIVSLRAVEEELARGTLVRIPLESPPLERTFYVVEDSNRTPSAAAKAFLSFVIGPRSIADAQGPNILGGRKG